MTQTLRLHRDSEAATAALWENVSQRVGLLDVSAVQSTGDVSPGGLGTYRRPSFFFFFFFWCRPSPRVSMVRVRKGEGTSARQADQLDGIAIRLAARTNVRPSRAVHVARPRRRTFTAWERRSLSFYLSYLPPRQRLRRGTAGREAPPLPGEWCGTHLVCGGCPAPDGIVLAAARVQ